MADGGSGFGFEACWRVRITKIKEALESLFNWPIA